MLMLSCVPSVVPPPPVSALQLCMAHSAVVFGSIKSTTIPLCRVLLPYSLSRSHPPDVREQAEMFASHGVVIQPHGAGETNIVYVTCTCASVFPLSPAPAVSLT
jgi:hypothetical protein